MSIDRTPLVKIVMPGGRPVWVKDESACPTGTFKDRLASHAATLFGARGVLNPETVISCITLGNTLVSFAEYLLRRREAANRPQLLGLFPSGFGRRTIGPDTEGRTVTGAAVLEELHGSGAHVLEYPLEAGFLGPEQIEGIARGAGLRFERLIDVSYGIGEPAYEVILAEALHELAGEHIKVVVVPVGAGVLFEECVALIERERLPMRVMGATTLAPQSIADKLYAYYSPFFKTLTSEGRCLIQGADQQHVVECVADVDILEALRQLAVRGISAEPSAAAAFALLGRLPTDTPALVINTGNGLRLSRMI